MKSIRPKKWKSGEPQNPILLNENHALVPSCKTCGNAATTLSTGIPKKPSYGVKRTVAAIEETTTTITNLQADSVNIKQVEELEIILAKNNTKLRGKVGRSPKRK